MGKIKTAFGFELGKSFLGQVPFSSGQRQQLGVNNGELPKDYFLWGMELRTSFRLVISGGTINGRIPDEFPQNLVERIEISGNHKVFGDYTRLLLQGSHIFQLSNIYGAYSHERTLGGLTVGATGGAAGTYDCVWSMTLPFVPLMVRPEEQLLYLLDCPMWTTLYFNVDWGTTASLVVGGDRVSALTAFGSGAGSPSMDVARIVAKLGDAKAALQPIPRKLTYKSVLLETTQGDSFVANVNVGNFLRAIILVTGTRATGGSLASKGDNFATLSNALFTRIKLKKDDIPIRDMKFQMNQDYEGDHKDLPFAFPTGYNILEFAEDGTLGTSLDTRDIAKQNLRLTIEGDVTGAVDQRLHLIYDELAGVPVFND